VFMILLSIPMLVSEQEISVVPAVRIQSIIIIIIIIMLLNSTFNTPPLHDYESPPFNNLLSQKSKTDKPTYFILNKLTSSHNVPTVFMLLNL
jgi:hypothetical protein